MSENICPKCGGILKEGANFCGSCGNKIEKQNENKNEKQSENIFDEIKNKDDVKKIFESIFTEENIKANKNINYNKTNTKVNNSTVNNNSKVDIKNVIIGILLIIVIAGGIYMYSKNDSSKAISNTDTALTGQMKSYTYENFNISIPDVYVLEDGKWSYSVSDDLYCVFVLMSTDEYDNVEDYIKQREEESKIENNFNRKVGTIQEEIINGETWYKKEAEYVNPLKSDYAKSQCIYAIKKDGRIYDLTFYVVHESDSDVDWSKTYLKDIVDSMHF